MCLIMDKQVFVNGASGLSAAELSAGQNADDV
jgi:hypothetical protein